MYLNSTTDFLPLNRFWRFTIGAAVPFFSSAVLGFHFGWWGFDGAALVVHQWPGAVTMVASLLILKPDFIYFFRSNNYHVRMINFYLSKSFLLFILSGAVFLLDYNNNYEWEIILYYATFNYLLIIFLFIISTEAAMHPTQKRRPIRVAIAAITDSSLAFAENLKSQRFLNIHFVGFFEDRVPERLPDFGSFPVLGRFDVLSTEVMRLKLQHVLVSLPTEASYRFGFVLEQLLDTTCSVHYLHDFLLFKPIRQAMTSMGNRSVFTVIDTPRGGLQHWVKRGFDVVGAGLALVLMSPVLLCVAVWIKLDSPGPVFFRQNRWGVAAEPFVIYKFRSMTQEASQTSVAGDHVIQTKARDIRVTRVGAFIRRTSIDELPQLLNILLGSMSFVGPRPHASGHNKEYRGLIKGYMLRHKVKPGLTGWAQIHGFRGETDTLDKMEKRVQYDLDYLRNWNVMLDIYIVLRTVYVVVTGKNAY